jgi:hypothetical protein
VALVVGSAVVLWPRGAPHSARGPGERPELALLTSLPLLFGEGFALDSPATPATRALELRYRLTPIAVTDAASLRGKRLLLMAHARAQPAEALVDLDRWVRRGGRLVLLADPRLEFESSRALGDPLRPAPGFADTGLLAHWGMTLATVDGSSWGALSSQTRACAVTEDSRIARCSIGKGQVAVLADADFMIEGSETALRPLFDALARLE